MLTNIKADIRKLFTVRSTYILLIVVTLFASFMAFYVEAFWGKSGSLSGRMSLSPLALHTIVTNIAGMVATFACIIAILQVGHEYRYNTIMHTLTASSNRLKVFLSKALVLTVFSLAASSAVLVVALGAYFMGLSVKGAELPLQDFDWLPELARVSFYFAAYGLIGFLLGILLRNLTVAVTALFLLPTTLEPLLSLLLKQNAAYLPFSAVDQVVRGMPGSMLSVNEAVVVTLGYLVGFGLLAWVLFLRRDAN